MSKAVPILIALLVISVSPAAAQYGTVSSPGTWVSGWIGGYLDPGSVNNPEATWDFGPAMAAGAGVHRQVGRSLQLGLDATLAPSAPYELTPKDGGDAVRGNARLASGMATARLRYGGFDAFSMYLTGGAGAFVYGMPDQSWDPDLALLTGAGIEYRPSGTSAIFLEWGQYRTYHQSEGVQSNTTRHSQVRAGGRMAW